jgi:uncharacterized sulfatase
MDLKKESNNNNLLNKLVNAFKSFTIFSCILLCMLLLLRAYEIGYNGVLHGFAAGTGKTCIVAILNDVLFWLTACGWLFIMYVPLYIINVKAAKVCILIAVLLIGLLNVGLVQYFTTALVPLGADLYAYSFNDIRQTAGASGQSLIPVIITVILLITLLIIAFNRLPKKIAIPHKLSLTFVIVFLLVFITSPFSNVRLPILDSEFLNNLSINKTHFFLSQTALHFVPADNEIDIYADSYIGDYGSESIITRPFHYVDEQQYPFLHIDSTSDVLSPFFNKGKAPPNIVLLLVEGLGRAFTNEGAYLGNFTPFIDSLSRQSLYWENFLSEGGRTFAVLPSILGSLPFGKNGFAEMGDNMPHHLSLISLLKLNGYHTSFYYGGDSKFDNMKVFLQKNNVDELHDDKTFGSGYQSMPVNAAGFSWGFGDKELFRRYFDTKKADSPGPYLSILLTLSTHTPFLINEQQTYLQKFEQRMTQLGFDEAKKSDYRNYQLQYASILYADDAIKNFFASYARRSEFSNTIFLITGDHRMPEIPMSSKIDRYHVPLIVYSPLLKRTAKFSSVSTHFDVTPGILAFLKASYNLQQPTLVSWMGSGLDTARALQNIHAYPLLQTKTDLVDFVMDNNMVNNNNLFMLSQNLTAQSFVDEDKLNKLRGSFDQFKNKNDQFIRGAKLIPDTIYNKYFPR